MNAESKHQMPGMPPPGNTQEGFVKRHGPRPEPATLSEDEQKAVAGDTAGTKTAPKHQTPPPAAFQTGQVSDSSNVGVTTTRTARKDTWTDQDQAAVTPPQVQVPPRVQVQPPKKKTFGDSGPQFAGEGSRDFQAAALPSLTKQAMFAARKWQLVPDTVTDEQALAQGIITPDMLMFIMQIVMQLMQGGCLSNSRIAAWNRVKGYSASKEIDRVVDNIRLNSVINHWMDRLAIARDVGDVVMVRRAIVEAAEGLSQDQFNQVQAEILFLTI